MIISQRTKGAPPPKCPTLKGLNLMTTYNTTTLAQAIIGDEAIETNKKAATRTLRKFLRDEVTEKGGKVGTDTPGKGGRYSIDMNKRELNAMIKRFRAWEIKQEEARKEREAARNAAKVSPTVETDIEDNDDDAPIEDNADETPEGPSDEEIAAMLSDEDEAPIEDDNA